jgi:4-amino-4-deoxy-L-arabinose transferase-like glycosyltransferase
MAANCQLVKQKIALVAALAVIVYGANFWAPSIYILDEAKNAGCAQEMWQTGNWMVPYFNGELRTDKPPLHYFFMILSYSVFGSSAFAARLFSVLCGVVLVIHAFVFTRKHFNEGMAGVMVALLLGSLQLAIQFHLAVPDPYLILCFTSGLFFFYEGYIGNRNKLFLFYALIALGFLAKGLIAVIFPGLIIFIFLLFQKQFTWRGLLALHLPTGILLFCALALPWYIGVGIKTDGAWLEGFFLKHNLDRYTATMEGHRGFFLAPFLILVAGLLPTSLFVVQAVRKSWKDRHQNLFIKLCLITVVVVPLFFSFSKTLLPGYPAPALPFFAMLLAYYLQQEFISQSNSDWAQVSLLILHSIIACAIPVAVLITIKTELPGLGLQNLWVVFLPLPLTAAYSLFLYWKKNRKGLIYTITGGWVLVAILFFWIAFPRIDKVNPVSASLPLVHKPVAYFGGFNPAYRFALQQNIPQLRTTEEVKKFVEAGGVVISQRKFLNELDTTHCQVIFSQKDLFERPVTVILSK